MTTSRDKFLALIILKYYGKLQPMPWIDLSNEGEKFWQLYKPVFEGKAPFTPELLKQAPSPGIKQIVIEQALLKKVEQSCGTK